ncbi:MAG: hypothetical protein ACOCV2_09060, partial [Persicimonas sp.]
MNWLSLSNRTLRRMALGIAIALVWCLGACSGAPSADDEEPSERAEEAEPPPRPGAAAWQEHALKMPADAPVALWARSGRFVDALGDLRRWLFDQPEMFGSRGEQLVGGLRGEWEMFV